MPNALPWFHSRILAQRMSRHLSQAVVDETLSVAEYQWLRQLPDQPNIAHDMRVHLLTNADPGIFCGLMLTRTDEQFTAAYFYSPVTGIRTFDSQQALQAAFDSEAGNTEIKGPTAKWLALEQTPMRLWMQAIIAAQALRLRALDRGWQRMPRLRDVLDNQLKINLRTALPASDPIDPQQHMAQRIDIATGEVVNLITLSDVALQSLAPHPSTTHRHRFLGVYGNTLDRDEEQLYASTLTNTAADLHASFSTALNAFWNNTPRSGLASRRQALSKTLQQSYLCSVMQAQSHLSYPTADIDLLLSLVARKKPAHLALHAVHFVPDPDLHDALVSWPGALVISDSNDPARGYYVYATDQGFTHCTDTAALSLHFDGWVASADSALQVVGADRALFKASVLPRAQRWALTQDPFNELASGLIDLQRHRVLDALADRPAMGEDPLTTIARATDLRQLVHPQLQWMSPVEQDDTRAPATRRKANPSASDTWLLTLDGVQQRLNWQRLRSLTVAEGVQQLLAHSLLAIQSPLPAQRLQVRIDGAPELEAISLLDYFLERASGAITQPLSPQDQILDNHAKPVTWPDLTQIERIIKQHSAALPLAYKTVVARQMASPQASYQGTHDLPAQRRAMREQSLRINLAIERRAGKLDSTLLDLLGIALDRPSAALRNGLDVDVHGLVLKIAGQPADVPLSNVWAIHRHSEPGGPVLMWSSQDGLRAFDSLAQMKKTVATGVAHPLARERWVSGTDASLRARLNLNDDADSVDMMQVGTHLITADFLADLEALETYRRLTCVALNCKLAMDCHFSAQLTKRNVDYARADDMLTASVEGLAIEVANAQLTELLPKWLADASADRLMHYTQVLHRCLATANAESNYLSSIPFILDFSRQRLIKAMAELWPDGVHNPDRVLIKLTDTTGGGMSMGGGIAPGWTSSQTRTLSEWAVDQFSGSLTSEMDITLDPPSLTLATPSTHQVRTLVNHANVGGEYRKLLAEKLAPSAPDYAQRRRLFARALPAQMIRHALEQQMQGKLSEKAAAMVENLVDMPDGLARESLNGQVINLSPLGLIPDTGMAADEVCGMYVIAPDDQAAGPVLLYTAYSDGRSILEFSDRAGLLAQIRTDKALQAQILSRLPAQAHPRYEYGGFTDPHIPWTTEVGDGVRPGRPPRISLLHRPISGNVLYFLYEDNIKLIELAAKEQTLSSGEAIWNAFCHLLELGLEQGALILPSPIGSLVAVYQAHALVHDSSNDLTEKKWGKALAELVAALASIVGARHGSEELKREIRFSENTEEALTRRSGANLSSRLRQTLEPFEVTDVSLASLTHDSLLNLYKSADGQRSYAIVQGRVYEVAKFEDKWLIIAPHGDGPPVVLDDAQKWHIKGELARMGAGYSLIERYDTWVTEQSLTDMFTPQAKGIAEIRQLFPRHHQMIVNAHVHSVECLRTTLANLNKSVPHLPLAPQTTAILRETFEADPSPALLFQLRSHCSRLLSELTSPSLDPQTSLRYWDGFNEPGHQHTQAFIWETDPQKRIFLTDEFFKLPNDTLMYSSHLRTQAQLYAHHQAASLLHELSHLTLGTVDLAYLDSFMPLLQHFDDSGGRYSQAQLFAHSLERVRQEALSLATPDKYLFTRPGTRGRRDFRTSDGRQREVILHLTGKSTLAEARKVFRTRPDVRARINMVNADSLTWLILRLGQQRFIPSPG